MNDLEYKRLKRLILWSWGLLLLVLVAIVVVGTAKLSQINNSIAILDTEQRALKLIPGPVGKDGMSIVGPQGIQGAQGLQGARGLTGQQGIQGPKGNDGASVTPEQIAAAVITYLQANPPAAGPKGDQGTQGDPGVPGREIEMRADPSTKELEWRYVGTTIWRDLGVHGD